ncbi:MAG TPA: hypothetical protein VIY27_11195 [Myxococcota bacterium]
MSQLGLFCQRWRDRRDSYRPAGETIDPRSFEVAPIPDDSTARAFVERHHYSASYPAARERFGLHRGAELVGVAVFSVPVQPRALDCLPGEREASVELGRFVLVDDVRANGESWFLARCFEHLRAEGYTGVVSFSDPVARPRADGSLVHGGHVGTIYQATNALYLGRSKPDTLRLLPDGTCLHRRARAKLRAGERGAAYVERLLASHGARARRPGEARARWADDVITKVTRPLRHAGNHKYAWALRRADRRHMPASLPYPKMRS